MLRKVLGPLPSRLVRLLTSREKMPEIFPLRMTLTVHITRSFVKAKVKQPISMHVSSVPLDGVSFHTKESVSLWKYVVKRNIVDEKNWLASA